MCKTKDFRGDSQAYIRSLLERSCSGSKGFLYMLKLGCISYSKCYLKIFSQYCGFLKNISFKLFSFAIELRELRKYYLRDSDYLFTDLISYGTSSGVLFPSSLPHGITKTVIVSEFGL